MTSQAQHLWYSEKSLRVIARMPEQAQGRQQPDALLAALPQVLASTRDAQRPVRGSALVTLAACLGALGMRVLPQLAPVVDGVLSAAASAAAALPDPQKATPADAAQPKQAIQLSCLDSCRTTSS